MTKFISPRVARVAAGLAVVSAFAAAPMMAQAADTDATGTLNAGALSTVAPAITPFTASVTGVNQTVHAAVGAWSLTDAVGDGAAYNVGVSAGAPSIGGTSIAGSVGSTWLALTPTTATPDASNPATDSPTAVAGPVALNATTATIENAAADVGAGKQNFAADTGAVKNLAITIPGNAQAGAYSDTLTYTIAAGAGA